MVYFMKYVLCSSYIFQHNYKSLYIIIDNKTIELLLQIRLNTFFQMSSNVSTPSVIFLRHLSISATVKTRLRKYLFNSKYHSSHRLTILELVHKAAIFTLQFSFVGHHLIFEPFLFIISLALYHNVHLNVSTFLHSNYNNMKTCRRNHIFVQNLSFFHLRWIFTHRNSALWDSNGALTELGRGGVGERSRWVDANMGIDDIQFRSQQKQITSFA